MLSVREVVIVEGRYDKNTVLQAVDATVVETAGFGVFSDREKQKLLRSLAERRGIVVLTDSDGAGFVIRNFLKNCAGTGRVKNAYIPDVFGKEKRKSSPSKEGKLGVEGMAPEVIVEALRRAGATFGDGEEGSRSAGMTKADLYALGLSGRADSAARRRALQRALGLPERLTANGLLEVLNIVSSRAEVEALLTTCR